LAAKHKKGRTIFDGPGKSGAKFLADLSKKSVDFLPKTVPISASLLKGIVSRAFLWFVFYVIQ
jgi:hypothetical protein